MASWDTLSDYINSEADYNFASGLELLKRGGDFFEQNQAQKAQLQETMQQSPAPPEMGSEGNKRLLGWLANRVYHGITNPQQTVATFANNVIPGSEQELVEQATNLAPMGLTASQVREGVGRGWLGSLRSAINRAPKAASVFGSPSKEGVQQIIESLLTNEGAGIVGNYRGLRRLEDSLKRAGAAEDVFAPVTKASGSIISPRNATWQGVHYPYSGEIALFSNPIAKAYTKEPTLRAANVALHEGVHAKQISDPAFLEALKELEPLAQQWHSSTRFPGGTSYEHTKYMADPIEMMARGVANKSMQRLYPNATPQNLYGPGTWYYTETWPKEAEPIWDRLTDTLLKGY